MPSRLAGEAGASEAVTIIPVGRGAVNAKSQPAMAFWSRLVKKSFCACKMDFFRTQIYFTAENAKGAEVF
jgi:hypothetical protein